MKNYSRRSFIQAGVLAGLAMSSFYQFFKTENR